MRGERGRERESRVARETKERKKERKKEKIDSSSFRRRRRGRRRRRRSRTLRLRQVAAFETLHGDAILHFVHRSHRSVEFPLSFHDFRHQSSPVWVGERERVGDVQNVRQSLSHRVLRSFSHRDDVGSVVGDGVGRGETHSKRDGETETGS